MTWISDKDWADTFRPLIEEILRPIVGEIVVLHEATDKQDREQGFDYVLRTELGNVACRVRRAIPQRDITIRSWRRSGVRTEIDKLRLGHAQLYFYGWANEAATAFADYVVFDVVRFLGSMLPDGWPEIRNHDGLSAFRAGPAAELFRVPGCVLRSSKTLVPSLDPPGQTSLLHA